MQNLQNAPLGGNLPALNAYIFNFKRDLLHCSVEEKCEANPTKLSESSIYDIFEFWLRLALIKANQEFTSFFVWFTNVSIWKKEIKIL